MSSSKHVASSEYYRRSSNQECPYTSMNDTLRKEQSSPAVIQRTSFSLLRNLVSASGQGATALLKGPPSHAAIWRTRSVRNKTESYCILQLKQPAKGIAIQVAFTSPATTPREIRLLHAAAVNGAFRPLVTQHSVATTNVQQPQHKLTVSPNTQVQRYLKIEMQGHVVSAATGPCHAVCQLDVVQLSAYAAASAAKATQLPVPLLDSPRELGFSRTAATPPTDSALQPSTCPACPAGQAKPSIAAAAVSPSKQLPTDPLQQSRANAEGRKEGSRFNDWLDQTRSSLQKPGCNNSGCSKTAIAPATLAPTDAGIQHRPDGRQQQQQQHLLSLHQQPHQTLEQHIILPAAMKTATAQQQQQQEQFVCQGTADLRSTLEANRQQLLQLQDQYKLLGGAHPRQQQKHELLQPHGLQQHATAAPHIRMPGHATAAVLTAAGRPSTVLSLLKRSDSYSAGCSGDNSSLTGSMDSVLLGDSCYSQEMAAADDTTATSIQVAPVTGDGELASTSQHQLCEQHISCHDDSVVLMGSMAHGADYDCNSWGISMQEPTAAEPPVAERCGSSCSVQGPAADYDRSANTAVDEGLGHSRDSWAGQSNGGAVLIVTQQTAEQLASQALTCSDDVLPNPALVDSQSCVPTAASGKQHRDLGQALSVLPDRKVQSCPSMNPLVCSSNNTATAGPWGLTTGLSAAAGNNQQQHLRLSPHGQHTWLGSGAGVTLSPEVMQRGQLVKQSCPSLRFPRYDSHSPAKRSREDLVDTAAAREDSEDDEEPSDIAPRRSRLALTSSINSREWLHQPPGLQLHVNVAAAVDQGADQDDEVVTETASACDDATVEPAACRKSGSDATKQGSALSPTFHQREVDACTEIDAQQVWQQSDAAATPSKVQLVATAAGVQPEPAQSTLLQLLLFSSCDLGSSIDISQPVAPQQLEPHNTSRNLGVDDSPQKVHRQSFWHEHQQQPTAADDLVSKGSLAAAAPLPQTVHAMGSALLSPIAESPAMSTATTGPGALTRLGCAVHDDDSRLHTATAEGQLCKLQQAGQHQQQLQHDQLCSVSCPSSMPGVNNVQQPEELQELLAVTGSVTIQQECQPGQQNAGQQGPVNDEVPYSLQVEHSYHAERSSSLPVEFVAKQPCSVAAAVAGHFSRASGKAEGAIAGYHRVVSRKQHPYRRNSGGQSRVAAPGRAKAPSGSLTVKSDSFVRGGLQQQQRVLLGPLKVRESSGSGSLSTGSSSHAATASTAAGTEQLSTTAAVITGRQGSKGSMQTRNPQGYAPCVRTSLLELDLTQPVVPKQHSSPASTVSGGNSSSAAAASVASAGSAASGKGRGASRYDQLLKSQYGKAPLIRHSQTGAGRRSQEALSQLHASGPRPMTTSLCLADLVASKSGLQSLQQYGTSAGMAGTLQQRDSSPPQLGDSQQQGVCAAAAQQVTASDRPSQQEHNYNSRQQWHSKCSQSAQLPFERPADDSYVTRHAQRVDQRQQQQLHSSGTLLQQSRLHMSAQLCTEQPMGDAAESSPSSPNRRLNVFLPKLVHQQLLTPQTAEQPFRHLEVGQDAAGDSQNSSYAQRGPSPSTPLWLGMVSPKSGTKQQHAPDITQQLGHQQQQLQQQEQGVYCINQSIRCFKEQQGVQQITTQQSSHLQAMQLEQEDPVHSSTDAAMEASSASVSNALRCNSSCSKGSDSKQLVLNISQHAPAVCEVGASPAAAAVQHAVAGNSAQAGVPAVVQTPPVGCTSAASGSCAAAPAVHAASVSPTNKQQWPMARSCPLIASPIRASQVAARCPAMVARYRLQNVGQPAAVGVDSSSCSPGECQPAVVEGSAAIVAGAGWASTHRAGPKPGSSTVLVSIVKHGRHGQQEPVLLEQCYELEAQPIQDLVQLDVPASVDSCATLGSIMVADDCWDSVEALLRVGQQDAVHSSSASTEVSTAATKAVIGVAGHTAAAILTDAEEVASSDEPGAGPNTAEPSIGSDAGSMSSPGSCGSIVSSGMHINQQRRGPPAHLLKQGQVKSRLGLQQLAAANSAASGGVNDEAGADRPSSALNLHQRHDAADLAADSHSAGSSIQSYRTASSQMGTVWPHALHHHDNTAGVSVKALSSSVSSISSVGNSATQQPQEVQLQADTDQAAAADVHPARNHYHSMAQQQAAHSSAGAGSQHSSHCSAAGSASSSGMHSLWDETDPVAEASAFSSPDSAALPQVDNDGRARSLQHMPHRVRYPAAGDKTSAFQQGLAAASYRSIAGAAALKQSGRHARGGREARSSIYESLNDSAASDVSVVSEADSASSAAGQPQHHSAAAAAGVQGVPLGALHSQQQQEQRCVPDSGGTNGGQAASTSLSFAAMHHVQSGYSSAHSTPGISSVVAAVSRVTISSATAAAEAEAIPASSSQPAAGAQVSSSDSQEGSVIGSSGSAPVQAGLSQLSLDDLGVSEGQKAAGSRQGQSPSKPSTRDQSPNKLQPAKSGGVAGRSGLVEGANSQGSCDGKAASVAALSAQNADQERCVQADDAVSVSSRANTYTAAAQHRMPSSQTQQQPPHAVSSQPGARAWQQPQLQVLIPSSPKVGRPLGSAAVNFSPLHAGRSSKGSCSSIGQLLGALPSAAGVFTQGPVAPAAAALQPAFSADNLPLATAAPAAEGAAAATAGARQPAAAGSSSPYTGFSPLHTMMPGSGSCGKASKTHSRTKKDLASQEEDVSMVRKNLMDDMLRVAPLAEDAPVAVGYASTAADIDQQSDTHEVRDSKQGTAPRSFGFEQSGMLLHTPARLQKGSVLDKVTLQLPALGVSPAFKQQHSCSGDSSSAVATQQSQQAESEALLTQPSYALTVDDEGMVQGTTISAVLQESLEVGTNSKVSDSIQLMCQSSAAAAAALRAAAATPALIPYHSSSTAGGDEHPQQMQQHQHSRPWQQDANTVTQEGHVDEGFNCAVQSLDGVIPPIAAVATPQSILAGQRVTAACADMNPETSSSNRTRQQSSPSLPGPLDSEPKRSTAAEPSSDSKVQRVGAGPLSSGLLRRGNSAGSLSKLLAMSLPPVSLAAGAGLENCRKAATAGTGQAGAASGGESVGAASSAGEVCEQSPGRPKQLHATAATKPGGSPYLQQLEGNSVSAQQQQKQHRVVTASPLSLHRHNLQLRAVQQQQQAPNTPAPAAEASGMASEAAEAAEASPQLARPASSSCRIAASTPTEFCFRAQQSADAAGCVADAAGQDLPGVFRGVSCGGHMSPTPGGGSSGGAARMGRLRHRRARSDMPEYYPLSPLESPLHTAMPEDAQGLFELTLSPQVSAAAVAALAAAEAAAATAAGMPAAVGVSRLMVGQVAVEPPTSPLGSPLRHGLTSPAAMYRIQQQQLKDQASHQQLAAEQSGAAAVDPAAPPFVSREPSTVELQHKQLGVAQAVADAVAAYQGSISPTRLAKIQEYVHGLVSADCGGSILGGQLTPPNRAAPNAMLAATPGNESDAFDSFNLNNKPHLQTELMQHGQQLVQEQQGHADAAQQQHQLSQENSVTVQQQEVPDQQLPCQQQLQDLHDQHFSGTPSACLSRCSTASVSPSVKALLATEMRASASSTSSGSRHHTVTAGEGECATAVAQLLQVKPSHAAGHTSILHVQHEQSGRHDSSRSQRSSVAGSECMTEQHVGNKQPSLTSARLRQHSIASSGSHHSSSHQPYPLDAEPSYASSAAASHSATFQYAVAAARDSSLLASVQELLDAPSLMSASTESYNLQLHQQAALKQREQLEADELGYGFRHSQDSQQEAVMQSHGALLGPGPPELSTAAGGAVVSGDRPAAAAARPTAAPAGHALAGGVFRRSAQLLAGLAWQPADIGSVDSTAGSMAVASGAGGSMAGGLRTLDDSMHDDDIGNQLRASVNLVAGSLDISGPQAVRLTQQLWLNRLRPETVPEVEATAATAGSTDRSAFSGSIGAKSGHSQETAAHQSDRQQQRLHQRPQQFSRAPGVQGVSAQQQRQMGPLLAGRLAAMAAMRQLRRSSVGESPDVIMAGSCSLEGNRRSLPAAPAEAHTAAPDSTVATEEGAQGSYVAPRSSGIGRGRLTAAEAAAQGALTSSHSFGSGGVPGCRGHSRCEHQHQQEEVPVRLSAQHRHKQQQEARHSLVRASISSAISNEDGYYDHDDRQGTSANEPKAAHGYQAAAGELRDGCSDDKQDAIMSLDARASNALQQLLWGEDSSS